MVGLLFWAILAVTGRFTVAADGDHESFIEEFVKPNFLMEENDYNLNKLDDRLTEVSQNTDRKDQHFMMTGLTSTESDDVELIEIQFEEDGKESVDLHSEYPLLNGRTYYRFKRGSWNRGKVCTCRSDKSTPARKESGKPPTTKLCTCDRRTNKPKTIHRRRRPTSRRSHKSTSKRLRLSETDKKRLRAPKHRHSKIVGCKKDSTVRKDDKTATLEQSGKSDLERQSFLGVKDEHSTESDQEQRGPFIHEWLDWSPIQESLDLLLNEAPSGHDAFTDHIPMEFNDHNQMTSEKLHSNKEAQQQFDKRRGHSPEIQSEAVEPGQQAQGNDNIEADSLSRDTTQMEHQKASNSPKLQKSEKKQGEESSKYILVGCLAGLCVILIVALILVLCRRRRKNTEMSDNDDWVLELKQPTVFVSESSSTLPKRKTSDTAPAREQQKGSEEPASCDKADSAHIPPSYENVVGLHVACYENINFGSM